MTDVTKHYYAGSQRVATALYHAFYIYPGDDPGMEGMDDFGGESQTMSSTPSLVENNIVLTDLERLMGFFGNDVNAGHFTQYDFSTFDAPDLHESEYCYFDPDCDEFMLTPNTPNQLEEYNCICRENPSAGGHEYPAQCRIHTDVYWYHPDYLGNTEFVTDIGGYPYQHLFYSPFGEAIVSQQYTSGRYDNPHRFNAKELDPETGLYYYGARFYNPKTSIWLSVDPMNAFRSWVTPYNFVQNNPINLIDPTGMLDGDPEFGPLPEGESPYPDGCHPPFVRPTEGVGGQSADNSNSSRGLLNVPMAGGQSNNVPVVAGLPDPMNFDYKNREVITNSEDGKDYILFDNRWHEISKEEFVTFTFFDGAYTEVKIHRVALFEANYIYAIQTFWSGATVAGFGSAEQFVEKAIKYGKLKDITLTSMLTLTRAGVGLNIAFISIPAMIQFELLLKRMELYDAGVEAKRNR